VLMVMVDDLGAAQAHALMPRLAAFREQGATAQRAFAAQALCGPSRFSILAGREPWTAGYMAHGKPLDESQFYQDYDTLPTTFRDAGYTVLGVSKLFHSRETSEAEFGKPNYRFFPHVDDEDCGASSTCGVPAAEEADLVDAQATAWAIDQLDSLVASASTPWMLMVGLRRPHLPFRVPQRLLDAAAPGQPGAFPPPFAKASQPASDAPLAAHSVCPNLIETFGLDIAEYSFKPLPDQTAATVRQGYAAAAAWADELFGRLLDKLEALDLHEDTLVLLVGDHGFSLGEHMAWCKRSQYEFVSNAPLALRWPGRIQANVTIEEPVSLMDIYPTLTELAGVSAPSGLAGTSHSARFLAGSDDRPNAIFTAQVACFTGDQRAVCDINQPFEQVGFTVRERARRYTEWRASIDGGTSVDWAAEPLSVEFYNLADDALETENVAGATAVQDYQLRLKTILRGGFATCARFSDGPACDAEEHCRWVDNAADLGACEANPDYDMVALLETSVGPTPSAMPSGAPTPASQPPPATTPEPTASPVVPVAPTPSPTAVNSTNRPTRSPSASRDAPTDDGGEGDGANAAALSSAPVAFGGVLTIAVAAKFL